MPAVWYSLWPIVVLALAEMITAGIFCIILELTQNDAIVPHDKSSERSEDQDMRNDRDQNWKKAEQFRDWQEVMWDV